MLIFHQNKDHGLWNHTRGATRPKRAQVARPPQLGAPPRPFRPWSVVSASPLAYPHIYLKNLGIQEDVPFREIERLHIHDLRFGGQIGPAFHAGEWDFEVFSTTIITNVITNNHVLALHHDV